MDLLLHVALPALALLAARVPARYALGLAPLGVLPDLDGLTDAGHRILFHNVFFLAAVPLVTYLVARRIVPGDARLVAAVAAFCVGSHLLLDLADPTGWFYPVSDLGFYLRAAFIGDFRTGEHVFFPAFEAGAVSPSGGWSYPHVPRPDEPVGVHPLVSVEALLVVVLAVVAQGLCRWNTIGRSVRGAEGPTPRSSRFRLKRTR